MTQRIVSKSGGNYSSYSWTENVTNVVIDLTDGYKKFAQSFFYNANIVADKFHVLRLINPALNKYRKEVTGDKRKNPIRFCC